MRAIVFIAACLVAAPAHAILITNLDNEAHHVTVNNAGEVREVVIPPNGNFRTFGRGNMIFMTVEDQPPVRGENMNEYVIWDDGRLKLQRRRHSINKRLE